MVSAWVKGKRNGPISKCWVLICLVPGKSLLAASMPGLRQTSYAACPYVDTVVLIPRTDS